MAKQQKEKPKAEEQKPVTKPVLNEEPLEEDDFDFGGLPKDAPFKRNIGCGG